jgi:hypothetical protein
LPVVKTALLFVLVLAALIAAGCGSSGSSSGSGSSIASGSTTATASPSTKQTSYLQQFQAVNNRFEQSPQIGDLSQALTAATGGSKTGGGSRSLAAAEAPLQSYLRRLDTYIAELRGLHFPACARHFQQQIIKFESEGRSSVAKILPLLRTGNVARVVAYVRRASPELSEKLGQVEAKENSIENGGNDGC